MTEKTKIWMGNLPYSWDSPELLGFILANIEPRQYMGAIIQCCVEKNDRHQSKGFGFCQIEQDVKDSLLALNNTEIDNRKIKVREWKEKEHVSI